MVIFLAFINCCALVAQVLSLPNAYVENHTVSFQAISVHSKLLTSCQTATATTNLISFSFLSESYKECNGTMRIPPDCTTLTLPINGSDDIMIGTNIAWMPVSGATGYLISIGTASGVWDIANNVDVGNVFTYNPPSYLPLETQIFVLITPYNTSGTAVGCPETTFTTRGLLPNCTVLSEPESNTPYVLVDTNISWYPVEGAMGYLVNIGTDSGFWDIVDLLDVGNVTTFDPPADLPANSEIFVMIIPYRVQGETMANCEEESFGTETRVPNCTNLSAPLNATQNVSVDTNISWNAVEWATGYIVNIGTSSGATDIVNGLDVGNVTTYNPPTDLPLNTEIFVLIVPYNTSETAVSCVEESFVTKLGIPACTTISAPLNNTQNVSVDTNISWNAVAGATGYVVNIGTSSGATDIVNALDVGNVTTYNPPTDLPLGTEIFVLILPYNTSRSAVNCAEESFVTNIGIPNCTTLNAPLNGAQNASVDTNISWNAVVSATGYVVNIGTSSGATNIVNGLDVGNVTTYNPPTNLPAASEIFVTIVPYNGSGTSVGCSEAYFKTELQVPECTSVVVPIANAEAVSVTTVFSWNAIANTTGYLITIGVASNGIDTVTDLDVGNITSYALTEPLPYDTDIYVSIIAYNTSGLATDCYTITFRTEGLKLVIPKFFTPNGDHTNDVWQVKDPNHAVRSIHIFNRYGKLLFAMDTTALGWNGTFNNRLLPSNDYWYVLFLMNGGTLTGHFTLKR